MKGETEGCQRQAELVNEPFLEEESAGAPGVTLVGWDPLLTGRDPS